MKVTSGAKPPYSDLLPGRRRVKIEKIDGNAKRRGALAER
jgi:hypothetical protein